MKHLPTIILVLVISALLLITINIGQNVGALPDETAKRVIDSAATQNKKELAYRDSLFKAIDKINKKDWIKINNYITNKYETQINHIPTASDSDIDSFFTIQMASVDQRDE